jgi:hypothetical protein
MFRCKVCGERKFVLTETITITTSMLVDLDSEKEPVFNTNQVTRQYTLTCTHCGKVYMFSEKDYVDITKFDNEGVTFSARDILESIQKEGYEGKCNSNL